MQRVDHYAKRLKPDFQLSMDAASQLIALSAEADNRSAAAPNLLSGDGKS